MRQALCFAALAAAAVVAVPSVGEAFGRRGRAARCQPCYPCPSVWYYAPSCPPPVVWYTVPAYPPVVELPAVRQPVATATVRIKGKAYRIIPHPDKGDQGEDERDAAADTLPPGAKGSDIPSSELFKGTSRRVAKTTIFNGPVQSFDTVAALLDSLPKNSEMVGTIDKLPTTNRVAKEKKNVQVRAYIYAFKKEADNDYHVLVGDAPDSDDLRFLNTEVSAIPLAGTDENRDNLWKVRKAFQAALQLSASGPSSYFRPDPPIPVRLTGSLFWDVDHQDPPYVGPNDFKPKTPWEIHPISKIEFLTD